MVDFPKKGKPEDVWTYATRNLNDDTNNIIRDAVLSDATKIAGANIDAQISTRAAPSDILADPDDKVDGSLIDASIAARATPADILTNTENKLDGSKIDATISSRSTVAASDILAGATKIDGDRINSSLVDDAPVEGSNVADGNEMTVVEKDYSALPKVCRLEGSIDLTGLAGGDTVIARQYIQIKSSGDYVKYAEETYSGAQSTPLLKIDTHWARYKIKVTLQQTAGVNRTYDYQFFTKKQA